MTQFTKMMVASVTALAAFAIPSAASADRVYYLVGVRHVYRIGTDKYFHAPERKQIEEDYADQVSADNAHYQYQITHGGDSNTESTQLQSALNDLAVERESRLAGLYEVSDSVRRGHPSFNIKVDGPYQVIGVDYHDRDNVQVWDNYTAYAPWPGYEVVGPNPYGWNYGVSYSPGLFLGAYNGWYGGWVGYGRPAFVGFYGQGGPMFVAGLSVNFGIGIGFGFGSFSYNSGLGGYYHRGPGSFGRDSFSGRYISSRNDPRAAMAGRAGYAAGAGAIRSARAGGYATGVSAGARSSFAAGGSARSAGTARSTGGGFARSAAGRSYGHSAIGATARATAGVRTRSGATARTNSGSSPSRMGGGGTIRSSSGARSTFGGHSASARSSAASRPSSSVGRSGGARSSGSQRSGGGRSSGGGHRGG